MSFAGNCGALAAGGQAYTKKHRQSASLLPGGAGRECTRRTSAARAHMDALRRPSTRPNGARGEHGLTSLAGVRKTTAIDPNRSVASVWFRAATPRLMLTKEKRG